MEDLQTNTEEYAVLDKVVASLPFDEGISVGDKVSLISSVAILPPSVREWSMYLRYAIVRGLPSRLLACIHDNIQHPDVVHSVLGAFQQFLDVSEKNQLSVISEELMRLDGLTDALVLVINTYKTREALVGAALQVLSTLSDDSLLCANAERITTERNFNALVGVLEQSHQAKTHRLWSSCTPLLQRLFNVLIRHAAVWKITSEDALAIVMRLIKVVSLNYDRPEISCLLTIIRPNLSAKFPQLAAALLPSIINSFEFALSESWKETLQMELEICIEQCVSDRSQLDSISIVTCALSNRYYNVSQTEKARALTNMNNVQLMLEHNIVVKCIRLASAHKDTPLLVRSCLFVIHHLTWADRFPWDQLYADGEGLSLLIDAVKHSFTEEIVVVPISLLMHLAQVAQYSLPLISQGFNGIWALVVNPPMFMAGISLLIFAAENNQAVIDWLQDHEVDRKLVHLYQEKQLDLPKFKMTLDMLHAMDSKLWSQLRNYGITVVELTSIVYFYSSSEMSDTFLPTDNCAMISRVIKLLTDVIEENDDQQVVRLCEAGYGFTLMLLVWKLQPEQILWREAAASLYELLLLEGEMDSKDQLFDWFSHVTKLAKEMDPQDQRFKKMQAEIRKSGGVKNNYDPKFNAFFERLFKEGMKRRRIMVTAQMGRHPSNAVAVGGSSAAPSSELASQEDSASPSPSCARCGRVPTAAQGKLLRCGRCKNAWFCDAKCQRGAWPNHKRLCSPPSK